MHPHVHVLFGCSVKPVATISRVELLRLLADSRTTERNKVNGKKNILDRYSLDHKFGVCGIPTILKDGTMGSFVCIFSGKKLETIYEFVVPYECYTTDITNIGVVAV